MAELDLKEKSLENLTQNLNNLVSFYRKLLVVVRNEKEILISAQLDNLNENNKKKEELILKIRSLDKERVILSKELANIFQVDSTGLRLNHFFPYITVKQTEKLQSLQTVLEVLIKRVSSLNKFNEQLVKSALDNISGAMSSIKTTLSGKSVYQSKGKVKAAKTRSGQLVSKEV